MRPEGTRRFCEVCDKHVHDLSSMTPGQAQRLVAEDRRELCVRYLHDGEEIVHLAPAPREPTRSLPAGIGVAAGLVAGLLASCTPHGRPAAESYEWEERAVPASVHDGVVIPAAEDAVGDEPCATTEPEPDSTHRAIKGKRKLMGKPAPRIVIDGGDGGDQGGLSEVVGDGL